MGKNGVDNLYVRMNPPANSLGLLRCIEIDIRSGTKHIDDRFAVHHARHVDGQRAFANLFRPCDQVGVGQPTGFRRL